MSNFICLWSTYKNSHCKKIINIDESKKSNFCAIHEKLVYEYKKVIDHSICETSQEIFIVPRNYNHVIFMMKSCNNDDDMIDVHMKGGSIERADITNQDYILLMSDNSMHFYSPIKGQHKAKDLRIKLVKYCENKAIINTKGINYCEECYKKLKDVPRISVLV